MAFCFPVGRACPASLLVFGGRIFAGHSAKITFFPIRQGRCEDPLADSGAAAERVWEYAAGACPAGVSLFDGFASDRVSSGHFRVRAAYGPFRRRGKRNGCSPQSGKQPSVYGAGRVSQASMLAYLAFRSMNSRRGGTSSPISIEKMRSASAALSIVTWRRMRVCGFMVVSHNCSAFISPRPL